MPQENEQATPATPYLPENQVHEEQREDAEIHHEDSESIQLESQPPEHQA